jgi:hypothetical protein
VHENVFLAAIEDFFRTLKKNVPQNIMIKRLISIGMDNLENANRFAFNRLSWLFCHFVTPAISNVLICSSLRPGRRDQFSLRHQSKRGRPHSILSPL